MSDLHSLATDLFTFFFPYFWLLMLGRYYFLVTSESFFDWRFYLLPFWHAFVHMISWMPPAWTLSWSLLTDSLQLQCLPWLQVHGGMVDLFQVVSMWILLQYPPVRQLEIATSTFSPRCSILFSDPTSSSLWCRQPSSMLPQSGVQPCPTSATCHCDLDSISIDDLTATTSLALGV